MLKSTDRGWADCWSVWYHSTSLTGRLQLMLLHLQLQEQQQSAVALAALTKQRRKWQYWDRLWLQRRITWIMYRNCSNLMLELQRDSQGYFTNYMKMSPRMFHELLLDWWSSKPSADGLLTLRWSCYMASSNSYHSLLFTQSAMLLYFMK